MALDQIKAGGEGLNNVVDATAPYFGFQSPWV